MTAAFIVTVNIDDSELPDLGVVAEEIADAVDTVAVVVSVQPWHRPVTAPQATAPLSSFPTL